jgi:molecular chaperone GrpE
MIEENIDDVTFEDNKDNIDHTQDTEQDTEVKKPKAEKKSRKLKAEKKIEELTEKNDELNDRYLRLYSEFDNYRKRTNKERLELLKSASQDIIIDLLPVLDDFDRAIKAMNDQEADEETIKGVELVYNKLFGILSQKGLEPMNSLGKDFDTDFNEAITKIPATSKDMIGKVIDVIEKGYLLNGKIIRFAKVVVGS